MKERQLTSKLSYLLKIVTHVLLVPVIALLSGVAISSYRLRIFCSLQGGAMGGFWCMEGQTEQIIVQGLRMGVLLTLLTWVILHFGFRWRIPSFFYLIDGVLLLGMYAVLQFFWVLKL